MGTWPRKVLSLRLLPDPEGRAKQAGGRPILFYFKGTMTKQDLRTLRRIVVKEGNQIIKSIMALVKALEVLEEK